MGIHVPDVRFRFTASAHNDVHQRWRRSVISEGIGHIHNRFN